MFVVRVKIYYNMQRNTDELRNTAVTYERHYCIVTTTVSDLLHY